MKQIYKEHHAEHAGSKSHDKDKRIKRNIQGGAYGSALPHLDSVKERLPGDEGEDRQTKKNAEAMENILDPFGKPVIQDIDGNVPLFDFGVGQRKEHKNGHGEFDQFMRSEEGAIQQVAQKGIADGEYNKQKNRAHSQVAEPPAGFEKYPLQKPDGFDHSHPPDDGSFTP
jgi:hypothetical protein